MILFYAPFAEPCRSPKWTSCSLTISFVLLTYLTLVIPRVHGQLHMKIPPAPRILKRQSTPLIITNSCGDTIYPAILTQNGQGPGTGGFELTAGSSRTLSVAENWQGRVWGRTNCSFGTGSGGCQTGDCGGVVSCSGTGNLPTTLAEFTLDAGDGHTYYDISLVDGYNLPLAIVMHPDSNSSFNSIPQSLTNPSCVGTIGDFGSSDPYSSGQSTFLGTTAADPLPFLVSISASEVADWCPWNLQVSTSSGPLGGVYIYPDGNLNRPPFDPCYSDCAKYDLPQYCCTGAYGSPGTCTPGTYSKAAKSVCPDAYSYAFDDQTSTFIIPAGAGFEVVFCPGARSTNIIATSKNELVQLAQSGHVSKRQQYLNSSGPLEYDTPDLLSIAAAHNHIYAVASQASRLFTSSPFPFMWLALNGVALTAWIAW